MRWQCKARQSIRAGLIDMDKILTGHSAADRKQRSDIAEGVDDILQGMQGRKARLSEIVLKLKEKMHPSRFPCKKSETRLLLRTRQSYREGRFSATYLIIRYIIISRLCVCVCVCFISL